MSTTVVLPLVQQPSVSTPSQQWRPAPLNLPGDLDRNELDLAIKTMYDTHYTIQQNSVQSAQPGSKMASSALLVTGSGKAVATGLRTLSNIVVSIDAGAAASNLWVTATPSTTVPGAFDVYVWQPTGSGNNTPIAATAPATIRWHAWGT